mmetsp:Transcript_12705/g.26755  ORF Transcript_12705/g.26755 Transcript_12705/m.26755 type:complete len:164 (+) Transcript_12705:424-915(+)
MATRRLYLLSKPLARCFPRREASKFIRPAACTNGSVPLRHRMFGDKSNSSSSSDNDAESSTPTDSAQRVAASNLSLGNEWRKQQIDKLENRFKGKQLEAHTIDSEEDLQPMWKEMEGRVTRRKLRTLTDTGGKSGRMNIKKTDEDVWLQAGLYDTSDTDDAKK